MLDFLLQERRVVTQGRRVEREREQCEQSVENKGESNE
jgi:hypothetical protein